MLKYIITIILVTITTLTSVGQTLFFETLKNSAWTSDEHLNDAKIRQAKEIELARLTTSTDSITVNKTIWVFKDSLKISHYNAGTAKDSAIAAYKYEIDTDKSVLKIFTANNQLLIYKVAIVSTNSYAFLKRKKKL